MGRASISIDITSNFNPRGVDAAISRMEKLANSYIRNQGNFGKGLVDAGGELGRASSMLVNFGRRVAEVGDKMTMGITVPMGVAAAAAVSAATEIDTAWYNVRKTVDMTEEGYERLKQGAMELADTQPVDAATILNIESLGGQLGITTGYLEDFAKVVSGLDIATNMDATSASMSLAQFRNIVQMSEDDLDNFASALVDLGNHTATTESDIMDLALRFASAGHVAGMSNQEILGISAALSSLGMKAEAGGSALSRVINDISVAVDTNGEHLQAWADLAGMSIEEFSRAWKEDAAGTFEDVLRGIAASGDEMNKALEDAGVSQIRTSDAMRRLASSGDLMSESVERANKAWEQNTALTREVENRNESIQARWDTLKNKLTNDLATLGKPLAEFGLTALEGLEPMIEGFGRFAESLASASPETQRFAFNLAAVAAAAGPVLSVVGRLMQGVGNLGLKVAGAQQWFGRYTEALHTTERAMITNLRSTDDLASRLGLAGNQYVKAAGGVDQYLAKVRAGSDVISDAATKQERARLAIDRYTQAIGAADAPVTRYTDRIRSSSERMAYATDVNNRYSQALRDGAGSMTEAAQHALAGAAANKEFTDAVAKGIAPMDAAAQASGKYGYQNSKSAVETSRATKSAIGLKDAMMSAAAGGSEAAQAAMRYADSMEGQKKAAKAGSDALKDVSDAQLMAAAATGDGARKVEEYVAEAKKGGKGTDILKGALVGLGTTLATGAVAAGITYFVTQLQLAQEREENLRLATEGLHRDLDDTTASVDEQSRVWGSSIAAVDAAIESQAHLGEQFEQTNTQAQLQIAELDRAWDAISRYANHTGLSASEQYHLKAAIDAVNESCGTQYSVVDAANGKIADETGAILDNTGAIYDNIAARKQQIKLQAVEANYQAAYEQELKTKKEYVDAQNEFNDALDRYNELVEKYNEQGFLESDEIAEYEDLRFKLDDLRDASDRAGKAAESAAKEHEYWGGVLDDVAGSSEAAAGSLEQLLSTNSDFTVAFGQEGVKSLGEFAAMCETLGINFDSLNVIGTSAAGKIAGSFEGTAKSLVEALGSAGEQGQEILRNIGDNWRNSFSEATQAVIDRVAETKDLTLAEFEAMAVDLGVKGEAATRMFVEGLDRGMNEEAAANFANALVQRFGEDLDPAKFTALAERISTVFKGALSPEQAQAIASAYSGALTAELGEGEAVARAEEAARRIGEVVKAGMSPEQASAAAQAYSSALASGLTVDEAITKVNGAIDQINQATNGLSPDAASAAMQAFCDALASTGDIDAAVEAVKRAVGEINSAPGEISPDKAAEAMRAFADAFRDTGDIDAAIEALKQTLGNVDLTPAANQAASSWKFALSEGMSTSISDLGTVLNDQGEVVASGLSLRLTEGTAQGINEGRTSVEDAMRGVVAGVGPILSDAWEPAHQGGLATSDQYGIGISEGGTGVGDMAALLVAAAVGQFQTGKEGAGAAGTDTSNSYASTIGSMQQTAVEAAFATQLAVIASYRLGIAAAQLAGQLTAQAYSDSLRTKEGDVYATGVAVGQNFAFGVETGGRTAVAYATSVSEQVATQFGVGAGTAYSSGVSLGTNFDFGVQTGARTAPSTASSCSMETAAAFGDGAGAAYSSGVSLGTNFDFGVQTGARSAVASASAASLAAADAFRDGGSTAYSAGVSLGINFDFGIQTGSRSAVGSASSASYSAANAFKDGSGTAYSAGVSVAARFAAGITVGGETAVIAAQSIARRVAAILGHSTPARGPLRHDDVWGLHLARNLASGMDRGAGRVAASARRLAQAASVASGATVAYRVAGYRTPARAARVANTALTRASSASASAREAGATVAARAVADAMRAPSGGGTDLDALHRVVKSAVKQAISESGGLNTTVELDGKVVSRQLASSMDYELGRLDRMRG